ncbi:MAG: guanylate cyclase [Tatlockia sp.]|nr:guanylate cyclase [Tatlockia sp.]
MIVIFLLVLAFFAQNIDNLSHYPTLAKVNTFVQHWTQPLTSEIKKAIPHVYRGVDYSLAFLIVVFAILVHILSMIKDKMIRDRQRASDRKSYEDWRNRAAGVVSKEKLTEMDSKFDKLDTTKGKGSDRKKILKEFAMLKSQLDSMGQQLAFLAIDVVDSTGMKRNEDKYVAAYDFDRYNQLVAESLKQSGVVKYAMTPDGIMSCFRTVDDAVSAAKAILDKLKVFNTEEKKIMQDFQIRCGINAGFVYMDEDTPIEQISDRVIDIAGHMQKYAKPNCINIAASAIEPLKTRQGFDETADVIDEQKVYQWTERDG